MNRNREYKDIGGPSYPPESIRKLMEEFNQQYPVILPRKRNFPEEGLMKSAGFPPKICLELIEQFDITVQLLLQNILLCDDPKVRQASLSIFQNIVKNKNTIQKRFGLPCYSVHVRDMVVG